MRRFFLLYLIIAAVICTVKPAGAAFTNLLQDSGFEAFVPGNPYPYWLDYSTNFGTTLCTTGSCGVNTTAAPLSGISWVWFGGTSQYEVGWVSQTVTIPAGFAKLEFYLWIGTGAGDTGDNMTASIDDDILFAIDGTQQSLYPTYTLVSLDVSEYADNAPHTVKFAAAVQGPIVNISLDNASLLYAPGVRLQAAKAGAGSGTVASTDGKISCGADCSAYYLGGDNATLTAVADAGSAFSGWSGGGCLGTDNCTFTLSDNETVTATFDALPTTTTTVPGGACVDADEDTYGENCSAGTDCDDTDPFYTDTCPDCTAVIIPGVLGRLIGDKEKSRTLLIIGQRGADFGDNPEIKWESDAVEVLSARVFLKRFMLMRAQFSGGPLEKDEYRVLIDSCEGSIKWAR